MATTLSKPQSAGFDVSEERFVSHLGRNACDFFRELDATKTKVRLVHHAKRPHSQLLELEVNDGRISRNVIYKIPFSLENSETNEFSATPRPRLFPEIAPTTNGLREFRALEAIERHFRALDDERFGVISIFELLESPLVVVMEKSPDGDLKSLLKRATRFHTKSNSESLGCVFANVGT